MTKQKRDELLGRLRSIEDVLAGRKDAHVIGNIWKTHEEAACIRILRDVLADVVREIDTQDSDSRGKGEGK